ncbi:hypothetical protein [Enterococcus sp. LJL51]|uniref:hypothetical protein n=1 Tax=Enterococcus sp. LJL51 TaxID=3416656 RepID=UPI003CEBE2C0
MKNKKLVTAAVGAAVLVLSILGYCLFVWVGGIIREDRPQSKRELPRAPQEIVSTSEDDLTTSFTEQDDPAEQPVDPEKYFVEKNEITLSDGWKKTMAERGYSDISILYVNSSVKNKYFAVLKMTYDNFQADNLPMALEPDNLVVQQDGQDYYELKAQKENEYDPEEGLFLCESLQEQGYPIHTIKLNFTSGSYNNQTEDSVYRPITIKYPLDIEAVGAIYESMLTYDTMSQYGLDVAETRQEEFLTLSLPEKFSFVNDGLGSPRVLNNYTYDTGVLLTYSGKIDDLNEDIPALNQELLKQAGAAYAVVLVKGTPVAYYFETTTSNPAYELYRMDKSFLTRLENEEFTRSEEDY